MNMIEKILARASGKTEVRPGEVVIANVNLMVMHDLSANFVMRVFREELGGGKIPDPSRIAFVFDHNFSPATREAATTLNTVRQFAAEHGIRNLFDCGSGSLHHVIIENGGHDDDLLIASPVGSYFSGGVKPVTVWLSKDFTRAAPGGTGAAKFAGNYAASFLAQAQAVEKGCDQVVWLDAREHRWVEEMGGMNLWFVFGEGENARLRTPPLTGTLLPGITRESLLTLAPDLGIPAEEEPLSIEEWKAAAESGEMTEVFACGTAAVVTPVGHVKSDDGEFTIGDGTPGPVTMRLREELVGLQTGLREDKHGWITRF